MSETPAPRFGSAGALFTGAESAPDDDLPTVRPLRSAPAPALAEPVARSPRKPAKPTRRQSFVYSAVTSEVRALAPRIAARTERTVADLIVLGVDLLQDTDLEDTPPAVDGPPLSRPAGRSDLADMQIRVSPTQHDWLEKARASRGSVSMRRFTGAALAAYVRTHRHIIVDSTGQ